MRLISLTSFFISSLFLNLAFAQESEIAGNWLINEDLSDVTDDKVELALIAIGVDPTKGFFNRDNEYYRGGPVEQEMYDFISYEPALNISVTDVEYTFNYNEFTRPVYMDNRGNRVSLSNINEVTDFSFGYWENNQLVVEGRPRDGGFTVERYSLSDDAMQLSVELLLLPNSFSTPIELMRVYDRLLENEN
jgi:hypothetical protein